MIVSKWYGMGIVAAVCHKLAIDNFQQMEEQINAGGNLLRLPFLGLNFQLNVNRQNANYREQSKVERMTDTAALIVSIGNSFINPGWTLLSSVSYVGLKVLRFLIKSQDMDPRNKSQILKIFTTIKAIILGISVFFLIDNPMSVEVDPKYLTQ